MERPTSKTTPIQPNLSCEQQYALAKYQKGENLFITGPGGTGKTKLIEYFVDHSKNVGTNFQVCALTGCAAVLLPPKCNARTLHSWSGIKLAKGPNHQIVSNAIKNKKTRSTWRKIKVLIIDEVSMMSAKIFEVIEEIARTARVSTLPFGGIQVVFSGDFYQLPPVGTLGDPQTELFCFESPVWARIFPLSNQVELKTIFRQSDPKYKEILLQVRTSSLSEENRKLLSEYVQRGFDPAKNNGCYPTKLFPTRAKTDYLNQTMFLKLDGDPVDFQHIQKTDCKTYLEANTPLSVEQLSRSERLSSSEIEYEIQQLMTTSSFQEIVSLKKGAVVMCTVNLDMDHGICNGAQGIVTDILRSGPTPLPVVRFYNGVTRVIQPHFRQSEEYPTIAVGQIPLCLAWALTIHKIQGATLSMADIDIGGQIFEYGQTYVALSRVQSLEGLYLSAFNPSRIKSNSRVRQYYSTLPNIDYENELSSTTIVKVASSEPVDFATFAYREGELQQEPMDLPLPPTEKGGNNENKPDPTIKKIRL
jgi:ATP-dependent DNA helicase PIF1